MIITLKRLKFHDACKKQIRLFERTFGDSVEVTLELCLKHLPDFDYGWFACFCFSHAQRRAYNAATAKAFYDASQIKDGEKQ